MPHDKNGKLVQKGDRVLVECEVVDVQPAEDFCNANVRTLIPMPPYKEGTSITLNTRQLEKIEAPLAEPTTG